MPIRHHFELRETIVTIVADRQDEIDAVCLGLANARREVEEYILTDPFFKTSFEPLEVSSTSPVIMAMAQAAQKAGVGPMASVAGAVARFALENAMEAGSRFCIIDNGGDIAILSDRPVRIGLYAGDSPLSGKYAFFLEPSPRGYGVCTSSATVGHSISLGIADSVSVFGSDPILADAVATAVCNQLTPESRSCLEKIPDGVDGIFAVFEEECIIWGKVPPIVPAHVRNDLITAGFAI